MATTVDLGKVTADPIKLDTEFSDTSENGVQNKVIKKALDDTSDAITLEAVKLREQLYPVGRIVHFMSNDLANVGIGGLPGSWTRISDTTDPEQPEVRYYRNS